jgi:AcrR family transcriptional regulator
MTTTELRHDTKDQILDAAEKLFAEVGFGAASVREITHEAGVNLAAVNYHFGSKEGLVRAVVERRVEPLNATRLELLRKALARRGKPRVRDIVHAFVTPVMEMLVARPEEGRNFIELMGRLHMDPGEMTKWIARDQFGDLAEAFIAAMEQAMPELDRADVLYRFHFALGALAQTVACGHVLHWFGEDVCSAETPEEVTERLISFIVGGLRAPVPERRRGRKK